jgi:hypothetical protein
VKLPWLGMLLLAFGVTPVNPQGYALISSECASTITVTVLGLVFGFVIVIPNKTARRPSGAKSVRVRCSPSVAGRLKRT